MSLFILSLYILLGFISFIIILLLKNKFNLNKLNSGVFSIIIIIIYASLFNTLGFNNTNKYIFLVLLFQFIFDFIYKTYILEEDFFNKNNSNLIYYFILIFIGLLLNNSYINVVKQVFLSGEDIRLIVWTLGIIFIFKFLKDEKLLDKKITNKKIFEEDSIILMYTRLRRKYLDDINIKDFKFELAIYSIMIFYNSKRSKLLRNLDNIIFKFNGKKRALGIMQIESSKYITDIESIDITICELKKILGKKTSNVSIESALSKYMGEDNLEVLEIYNVLKNFFKI